ncbi:hypothetical protein HK104_003301 [Borealophlyctis nickersoniae]|nr:hypothetical protein HK104_003301 [Borealophlyctis nickersoniae]
MASKPKLDGIPPLPSVATKDFPRSAATRSAASGERVRIPPRSQALYYELQLKELFAAHPTSPSVARTQKCFALLDDMIPLFGTLAPIVKILRDELYRSVYSRDLTSSDREPFVERVPWFMAVGRIGEARDEEAEKTNETLLSLHQKIKFREHDLQILYKKNLALKQVSTPLPLPPPFSSHSLTRSPFRQEITDQCVHTAQLKDEIARLHTVIQSGQKEKIELKAEGMRSELELKREIDQLQTSLAQANHIIEKLTVFKGSDDAAEEEDAVYEGEADKNKQELVIDSQGMVEYDIYQAERLLDQFAEILNYQLDDYESSLTQLRKKREILSGVQTNEEEREESYKMEMDDIVGGFRRRVANLLDEQKMIRKHIQGLKIILANYLGEKVNPSVQRTADEALRKYSAVVHISEDGGETFTPMKTMAYCTKCGDKTLICPHKNMTLDPVELPQTTTHVKFTQPPLRLRTTFNRAEFESDMVTRLAEEDEEGVTEDEDLSHVITQATKTFKKIWKDYYEKREGYKPKLNRPFPISRSLGFVQEIYDIRWAFEEEIEKNEEKDVVLPKFIDFFYEFMENRYQVKEVAFKAIHDILTALQQHEEYNSAIAIFVRHLAGDEDVMWKYLYLAKKLFDKYENIDAGRYKHIIQTMYPSRTKEMYEQMELEFVAFSKNRFSREAVEEHLMHMLRTNIEPNYKFFYRAIQRFDYQEQGHLSYEDFDECLGQILPVAPMRMKRVRYLLSEQDMKPDQVTVERLALIASYISLYCCYQNNWVAQALMAVDFVEGYSGPTTAEGQTVRLTDGEAGSAETAAALQEQVDKLLAGGGSNTDVDDQAVEEEAMKLAKRVEILQRMEMKDRGEEEDED